MLCVSLYMFVCVATTTPPAQSAQFCTPTAGTPCVATTPLAVPVTYCGALPNVINIFIGKALVQSACAFQENEHPATGNNHLKTGVVTIIVAGKAYPLFVIQRRYDDYGASAPVCDYDLDLLKVTNFEDRLVAMQRVLDETGVVPLVERFVQRDNDDNRFYVEFYPHIIAQDGDILIKQLINVTNHHERLTQLMYNMGMQTGRMSENVAPHTDCHPGNFLVTDNNVVFAIDCRGALRDDMPPIRLFLDTLLQLIRTKLAEDSSFASKQDREKACQTIYQTCQKAFISGVKKTLKNSFLFESAGLTDEMLGQ